jgi:hypothetical protein
MNISLPSSDQFNIKDCVIAGDECVLVTPKDMGVEWNEENKYFRSSIWRKSDMHLVSAGFKKFTNLGEQPAFEPIDGYTDLEFVRKLDGSLLIVSQYKGQLIVRTRGTIDATQLANGHEIELLKKKYPKAFSNIWLDSEYHTLLFEWTTPSNRIVLKESEEPCLWLIGIVCHKPEVMDPSKYVLKYSTSNTLKEAYHYFTQFELDQQASYLGVPRPERFELNLENVTEYLKDKDSIEGVVIYSNQGQTLKKVKTPRYLYMHKVFTGIKTVDHLFDLFVEYGEPNRDQFEQKLANNFDWELVTALKLLLDDLYKKCRYISDRVFWVVMYLQNPDFIELDRKSKAQKIMELFPHCSWVAFAILDGKKLDPYKLWKTFPLE